MGKLISAIHNYPFSDGSVAGNNKTLLEDGYSIRSGTLKDYLKTIFELSKDVYFYNDAGTNSNSWNDLLKHDLVFQVSRFITISATELDEYFRSLPRANAFNADNQLLDPEYKTLLYQRLQLIQYIFWFYKNICESVSGEAGQQINTILNNDAVKKLFIRYQALFNESLNKTPVLVTMPERINAPAFNEIIFPTAENNFTTALAAWYNPANNPGTEVLTVYGNEHDQLKAANEYAYSIFRALMQVQQRFTHWATARLQELTTNTNTHEPHIALLIAFSKMAMLYDARYNQLIHQNTAFIFREIIQLKKQLPLADQAYLSVELAKNVSQHFLPANTLFKAGKNSKGSPVYYRSVTDSVLNSLKIVSLKSSVRVRKQNKLLTITAADEASSEDWQVNQAWPPFNDLGKSYTGIGIESKMLASTLKKDTEITIVFEFGKTLPASTTLKENLLVSMLLSDESPVTLPLKSVEINTTQLIIRGAVEKDLTSPLKPGVNIHCKLASPDADTAANDPFALLYQFLLTEPISKIRVEMPSRKFVPASVETMYGKLDGQTSFAAFGAQSLSGARFRIEDPLIRYANLIDITINWGEALKEDLPVTINGTDVTLTAGSETTIITDFNKGNGVSLLLRLTNDQTYLALSKQTSGSTETTIETTLPRIFTIKSTELNADLSETIYQKNITGPLVFTEITGFNKGFTKSLQLPFVNKTMQKQLLMQRYHLSRIINYIYHYNNQVIQLYPFGTARAGSISGPKFLPDYTQLGFNDFEADLFIGLTNIKPGQSISLLFDIAEETADQSELEATIKWFYVSAEKIESVDPSRILDTTNNFLQTGIVQLTLPDNATDGSALLGSAGYYWLVARCDRNHEVVANIRSIKTNGILVERVLDATNQEAKKSVAPATIEQVFPKTANIKSLSQDSPSFNGRETESDAHYFWRSSQRLRHKNRGVNQWDLEQLVIEQFSSIYKVKCMNHAWYDDAGNQIIARPAHVLITLIPHYVINPANPNFQPAMPVSRLFAVKNWLQQKTSAFLQFQVLNAKWDVVTIEISAVFNHDILDLLYYGEQLNRDLQRFFSPWAFEAGAAPLLAQKIYQATLVDYVDELPYVHHIHSMRILRNGLEINDEINASSAIHILTSSVNHLITPLQYGS